MKTSIYIFGAGASSKAMPLVNNFSKRFDVFKEYIDRITLPPMLKESVTNLSNKIAEHFSIDTYFKKLFHQSVSNHEILKAKTYLLLFFLFEHLVPAIELKNLPAFKKLTDDKMQKTFNLDPRYEALIAGLLKPIKGKAEFFCNINFITWNYDINLIYALKNFVSPEESLIDFIDNRLVNKLIQVNEQVKLFHMNGFAYHPVLEYFNTKNSFNQFNNILNDFVEDDFTKFSSKLKFSWEQSFEETHLAMATYDANNICLVGYSLPLYNRLTDSIFINNQTFNNKELYIQDLYPDSIAEILESDFDIITNIAKKNYNSPKVHLVNNCNNFTVPNKIFN